MIFVGTLGDRVRLEANLCCFNLRNLTFHKKMARKSLYNYEPSTIFDDDYFVLEYNSNLFPFILL